ncbi:hypothetical protein GCM10010464_39370 [Pseudonocardia yunnanensis]|uniref:Integral membrane protein n=1 Tax=Pseudonocardia yunnanensis TaxID=58107 RepID=A0ABW4EZB2_9PSEU
MIAALEIGLWLFAVMMTGNQVLRAWSRGAFAAPSRFVLVSSTVDAVVALAFVRAVIPPPGLLSWAWVIAAVAVGIGIAGVILRWPTLGWGAPTSGTSRPTMRAVLTAIYAAVGAGMVVVLA